jgi:16S rRNA (uracil1498-N3)-methyltransferase
MPRFYVENTSGFDKCIEITGEDVNHIKNVLRMNVGDGITIGDGNGRDYICRISDIGNESVLADICDVVSNAAELSTKITLFQGVPKGDKLELIIQKAVELGASEIVPVYTERTVVKLDAKKEKKKLERYNMISMSAAKQSGRGVVPLVRKYMSFKQALEYAKKFDMNIIPYEDAKGIEESRQIISEIKGKKSLGIFIGPEGGFAASEVELAKSIGASVVTLGNRILRTETAGLAVLSIIMFEIEE